jgi:lipoate-protein ligase A
MDWKIIETEPKNAVEIMQKDRDLLDQIHLEESPILHFYEWKGPSVTYGHFLDPLKFFSLKGIEEEGITLAKRPTGGGIIFHLSDLAFSVLVPATHHGYSQNTLENYAYINEAVLAAVQDFLQIKAGAELTPQDGELLGAGAQYFCMAKPTRYDVMVQGKKVAGAAQRKTKGGFLHQGSISLMMPSKKILEKVLLPEFAVASAMDFFTYPLLKQQSDNKDLIEARKQIKELLRQHLTKR